jgi:serine/threonine-protein kinase
MEDMIGTTIEHYQIVERLGQGGMGAVYRATDTLLEREVALKLLRPEYAADPLFAERFRAEAVMLAKLSHPNIATLFGFVRDSTQLCMVMELATGETLGNLLKRTGALSWDRAILLTGQMLDALQYAHERGVVHRDIKPTNLMVGRNDQVKLMDFGIARLMGTTRVTQMGFTVGTLEYMAPEQIRGEDVDGRADIYATGVVLYEMVTGQLPFKGSREQALMFAHLQQEVVPPRTHRPNLPWHLSDVIVRALSKAPGDRFATAREFSDALGASPSATTASIRIPNGQTVSGSAAAPRRRTSPSRAVTTAAGVAPIGTDSDDETRIAPPPGVPKRGWLARWWPQVQLSSNRFGGAQEPGVMYQAAVGAGGFGGAIRIVAVRMGTAGRKAANTVTQAVMGVGHLLVRRPVFIALLLIGLAGGGWYWRQRRASVRGDAIAPTQVSVPTSADALAVAALAPTTAPASVPASVPAATPVAAPVAAPTSAPPASFPTVAQAPASIPTAPAAQPSATVAPPAASTPPSPAASAPAASAASRPAAPAASNPAAPATATPAAGESSRTASSVTRETPPVTRETVKSASVSASATPLAEKAPIPTGPDITLANDVTLLTPKDDDVEETDGRLIFRGNEIVIIDGDDKVLRTVRLRADGPGKGPAASGPARILSHRRTRWLVLPVGADQFVVQVDRDDVPKLTELLEARLGRPVTTVDGEPQFPKR